MARYEELKKLRQKLFDGDIDGRELMDRTAEGPRQLGLFRRGPSHERGMALMAATEGKGQDGSRK